jgi:hypothetical protein
MAANWSRAFDAPITTLEGRELRTLRDAGEYVAALADHDAPHWRTATEMLLMAAEQGGIVMFAEIAMRQALYEDNQTKSPPTPGRKAAKKYRIVR